MYGQKLTPNLVTLLTLFLMCASPLFAASIPETEITSLIKESTEELTETSATKKRRACKSTIRKANSLLEDHPNATNRFEVLAIILQSQRRLLTLDNSEKNRASFFETCTKLIEAPESYATLKLEAELALSEKKLSEKNASIKERATALEDIVKRYRNTPAEAKSLMIASLIAPKLEAFDLEQQLINTLSERFQSDHEAIKFRKKNVKANLLDVVFSGTFKTNDGTSLSFPVDRLAQTSLIYFWSKQTPQLSLRFADVKEIQESHPGKFNVYSLNLDELNDAGEKILREHDLDWIPLHLPGGKMNPTYQVYGGADPSALLVNAQGHALISSSPMHNGHMPLIPSQKILEARKKLGFVDKIVTSSNAPTLELSLDSTRYLSQLQSLFIGDFLVGEKAKSSSIPAATLDAIQACFTPVPYRYRISQKQALENYTKANELCLATIKAHPDAADLWQVRNRRIIALLGMWNLASQPKHLEEAVKEAQTSLTTQLPPEAKIVPQFCIAKNQLRLAKTPPTSVLAEFIKATGADSMPATAIAATSLLAMDANDRDIHAKYRGELLKLDNNKSTLWPVVSFLRDRHHTYRSFHATFSRFGFTRAERHANYRNVSALDEPADTTRVIKTDLTTLEGKTISLPEATENRITYLAILELPADEESEKAQDSLIKLMTRIAGEHQTKGIKVIATFLSKDTAAIKAHAKKHEWTCNVTTLPEGLNNPLVARYGILSADKNPNIFLLRPDGSISWFSSGLDYPVQGSRISSVIRYGVEAQLNVLQYETAKAALDQGDFKQAVKLFSEAWAPEKIKGDWWATFRYYSRARAYVGLKDWEAALADTDLALEGLKTFGFGKVHRCKLHQEIEYYKADILDQLGRGTEAKTLRSQAARPTTPHNKTPYGIYTDSNRTNFRLNPHSGK